MLDILPRPEILSWTRQATSNPRVNIDWNLYFWHHGMIKIKLCSYMIRSTRSPLGSKWPGLTTGYVIRSTRSPLGSQRPGLTCAQPSGRWLPEGDLVDRITQQHSFIIIQALDTCFWHQCLPLCLPCSIRYSTLSSSTTVSTRGAMLSLKA